jgi:hypothetical protein
VYIQLGIYAITDHSIGVPNRGGGRGNLESLPGPI